MGTGYSILGVSQWLMQGNKYYGKEGYQIASRTWKANDFPSSLSGEVYIVTGANAGLGRITAEALAKQQAEVHCLCRNQERGEETIKAIQSVTNNSKVYLHVVDVSNIDSLNTFINQWIDSKRKLHCLINNAGVLLSERTVNHQNHEMGMATALYQSYYLTGRLLPILYESSTPNNPSRIIHVSSGGGLTVKLDIDDLQSEKRTYNGTLQYAHAKRAQMEINKVWAEKIETLIKTSSSSSSLSHSIITSSMHPGWASTEGVKTSIKDFYEKNKDTLRTPEEGADTIVWLASSISARKIANGKFWFDRTESSTDFSFAGTTLSKQQREKLWNKVEDMTNWKWEGSNEQKQIETFIKNNQSK